MHAIRADALDMQVLLLDDRRSADGKTAPGGTCLNIGCITSKALLDSSKHFAYLKNGLDSHGIQADNPSIDVGRMLERKDKVVKQLTGGINQLLKANKVEFANARGKLLADRQVEVSPHEGESYTVRSEERRVGSGWR